MSARQGSSSLEAPAPPRGTCPGCGKEPGGERCIHCGVAARVGPYRVRKVLGQRGAARTYLADDVDGLVVLKELSFFTPPDAATLAAFHEEARQLQSLTHPRVPRYLDMLQLGTGVDTRLYLAQEFVEGTSLEQQLATRRATELEARELARQVLDILHYLQSRSPPVFHGDLKPSNLIRRPDDALFLVDFGAAWVRGETNVEPSRYTPPDQHAGELDVTTDFYALGVTLVDALTWEPEWKQRAAGLEELASHVDVSPSFREFLARLTASERNLRFTSAAEALRELESPEQAPPSRLSRRRVWLAAAGAGGALLLFGAGFVTGRATAPRRPRMEWNESPARYSHPGQRIPPAPPPVPPDSVIQEPATDHQSLDCEYAGRGVRSGSASSSSPSSDERYAFDRDLSTAWRSYTSREAWLQVDLRQVRTINGLVFAGSWHVPSSRVHKSLVQTSLDGYNWSLLIKITREPTDPPMPYRIWFPDRAVRYVRFIGAHGDYGNAVVSTFELYGPDCPLKRPATMDAIDNLP
ncbi:MAG TPA: discoidin domain-containing protein [Myxococcaceae bacterium]|jgi:serine/threonine protein kinase